MTIINIACIAGKRNLPMEPFAKQVGLIASMKAGLISHVVNFPTHLLLTQKHRSPLLLQ
jgi:hypothetical protein